MDKDIALIRRPHGRRPGLPKLAGKDADLEAGPRFRPEKSGVPDLKDEIIAERNRT